MYVLSAQYYNKKQSIIYHSVLDNAYYPIKITNPGSHPGAENKDMITLVSYPRIRSCSMAHTDHNMILLSTCLFQCDSLSHHSPVQLPVAASCACFWSCMCTLLRCELWLAVHAIPILIAHTRIAHDTHIHSYTSQHSYNIARYRPSQSGNSEIRAQPMSLGTADLSDI